MNDLFQYSKAKALNKKAQPIRAAIQIDKAHLEGSVYWSPRRPRSHGAMEVPQIGSRREGSTLPSSLPPSAISILCQRNVLIISCCTTYL